jgi:hypothetical protein
MPAVADLRRGGFFLTFPNRRPKFGNGGFFLKEPPCHIKQAVRFWSHNITS